MPSNEKGGASAPTPSGDKSRRFVPVGNGIGGIVLLGGVLAVGIVAGALVKMRRRRNGREIRPGNDDDHQLSGKILENSGEECGCGQSSPKLETKKDGGAEEMGGNGGRVGRDCGRNRAIDGS